MKKSKTSSLTITPRLLSGKRVEMKALPGYESFSGYGFRGKALCNNTEYNVYGADCGADCACDAVAVPVDSKWCHIIEMLTNDGIIPSGRY